MRIVAAAVSVAVVLSTMASSAHAAPITPIVGMAATPTGGGYWLVAADGGVFAYGDAVFKGSASELALTRPIVGMAATPSGAGYWLVAADGGVFAYGDAAFKGSAGSLSLAKPIVGMASTPNGGGYWLVAADGGVFAYGDAAFKGSAGDLALAKPIVGMASTPSGAGYWLVAADGGVFAYGDAAFRGSARNLSLAKPIVGIASTPSGGGYWLVAADGGVFAYGDAAFRGSAGDLELAKPIVGMSSTSGGGGYRLVAADGGVFAYGDATFAGSATQPAAPVVRQPPVDPAGRRAWTLEPSGKLVGIDGKCLDVRGPSEANGTAVQVWDCVDVANQRWTMTPSGELRGYAGKCLDVRGPSADDGTPVQIWDCVGVTNQRWALTSTGGLRGFADKCLDIPAPANGTGAVMARCSAGATPAPAQPEVVIDSPAAAIAGAPDDQGYWILDQAGHVYAYGSAEYLGGNPTGSSDWFVAMAGHPSQQGYVLLDSAGHVYAYGALRYHGGTPEGATLPFRAVAAHPSGDGYWIVDSAGHVYAYGVAGFHGGAPDGSSLPFRSVVPAADGNGYSLIDSAGQVYAYGSARYIGGSPSGFTGRIVAGAGPRTVDGLVLVDVAGHAYAYGAQPYLGGTPARLNAPIVSVAATRTGSGYWQLGRDHGVFALGDAPFTGAHTANRPLPLDPDDPANALSQGLAIPGLSARLVAMYQRGAASECPGLDWRILAAIGSVESGHGTHGGATVAQNGDVTPRIIGTRLDGTGNVDRIDDTDRGTLDGDTEFDRAVGPMQFIPRTWAGYGRDGNGDGKRDPFNYIDAVHAAAALLCANGGGDPGTVDQAILRYNRDRAYLALVKKVAAGYEAGRAVSAADHGTSPPTVSVRGFVVSTAIADDLNLLLAAAERAGHRLGGSGYRSYERQKELRTINGCREAMRGSDCRVPTAIPGHSMHEKGLAIDFTCNGAQMSAASQCFKWMKIHAQKFGFLNFPKEPWHWSTNGH